MWIGPEWPHCSYWAQRSSPMITVYGKMIPSMNMWLHYCIWEWPHRTRQDPWHLSLHRGEGQELPSQWLIHKRSQTEDGTMWIVWWNREYWDTGMGMKKLRTLENGLKVKKEETLTPSLWIKFESPPPLPSFLSFIILLPFYISQWLCMV